MATVQDVPADKLIFKAAKELEVNAEFNAPEWAKFVKTGVSKQRPPMRKDWWHTREAAVLRTVYLEGPIGTNALRTKYGGKKNMGYAPEETKKGSGSIARKMLQQLEKAGLVKKESKGVHKGRAITPAGKKFLDKIATEIAGKKSNLGKAELDAPHKEVA